MSHVDKMDLIVEDLGALGDAVAEMGGELRLDQKTYEWWGTHMGDYAIPEGMTKADLGRCDHAIHFPDAKWEAGVVKRKDGKGFDIVFDFYGSLRGGGRNTLVDHLGGKDATRLKAHYGLARAKREARKRGHRVLGVTKKDGKLKLKVQV